MLIFPRLHNEPGAFSFTSDCGVVSLPNNEETLCEIIKSLSVLSFSLSVTT